MKFLCTNCNYEKAIPRDAQQKYAGKNVTCPKCKLKSRVDDITESTGHTPPPIQAQTNSKPCPFCAELVASAAIKCKHCGEFLDGSSKISRSVAGKKLILPAFLLLIFFNGLGVHAFYAGRTKQGVGYIVMCLVAGFMLLLPEPLGIAGLVLFLAISVFLLGDLIRLISGKYKDGDGNTMVEWL